MAMAAGAVHAAGLEGKWVGIGRAEAGSYCWTIERKPGGEYQLDYRLQAAEGIKRHQEGGTWFHANGLYATLTQAIDGKPVDLKDRRLRNVYRVESLSDSVFEYSDIGSGTRFSVQRVEADFVLGDGCSTVTEIPH